MIKYLKKRVCVFEPSAGAQIMTVKWIIHATKTGILAMQLILLAIYGDGASVACEVIV